MTNERRLERVRKLSRRAWKMAVDAWCEANPCEDACMSNSPRFHAVREAISLTSLYAPGTIIAAVASFLWGDVVPASSCNYIRSTYPRETWWWAKGEIVDLALDIASKRLDRPTDPQVHPEVLRMIEANPGWANTHHSQRSAVFAALDTIGCTPYAETLRVLAQHLCAYIVTVNDVYRFRQEWGKARGLDIDCRTYRWQPRRDMLSDDMPLPVKPSELQTLRPALQVLVPFLDRFHSIDHLRNLAEAVA